VPQYQQFKGISYTKLVFLLTVRSLTYETTIGFYID
jgi:hypothetical protein